jgi:hypothetical protein
MKTLTSVAVCTVAVIVIAFPMAGHAASIEGTWSGSGFVKPKDSKRQKVRCRITYFRESKKVFGVRASCATTSNKILQTGKVLKVSSKRYIGDFYNQQFDISGRVRVSVSGSRQTVSFSSLRGHGRVSLRKR